VSVGYRIERILKKQLERRERESLQRIHGISSSEKVDLKFLRGASIIKAYKPFIRRLIDVGAHLGSFTATMTKVWDFDEIVCVEPDSALVRRLRTSIPKGSKIVEAALAEAPGRRRFFAHPHPDMNSLIPVDPEKFDEEWQFYRASDVAEREVAVRTLNSLVEVLSERRARDILLKVDVQGAELEVLKSGSAVLKLASVCVIEHMFWTGYKRDYDLADLLDLMRSQGFRCVAPFGTELRGDGRVAYSDLIFLPSSGEGNGAAYPSTDS
jgi:FkbM family methyltransferase